MTDTLFVQPPLPNHRLISLSVVALLNRGFRLRLNLLTNHAPVYWAQHLRKRFTLRLEQCTWVCDLTSVRVIEVDVLGYWRLTLHFRAPW